jgi:C1A family cysteine protease
VHEVTADPAGSADWVTDGCVNEIQNSGSCGSCWAFSTAVTLESSFCIGSSTKQLYKLSEQQLVDCSRPYGNNGCGGGWYYYAYDYAAVEGIEQLSDYPYTATDQDCAYDASKGVVQTVPATPFAYVGQYNNTTSAQIMSALDVKVQAVSVRASSIVWQTYSEGILTDASCGYNTNHAIAAVGYNQEEGYYRVRNSWGASWGDGGYINVGMREGFGVCGINQYVSYPNTQAWTPPSQ